MEIFNLLAILGALAWSPHLVSLAKSYLTKPEVRIFTQKSAEIGFSTFGPIFNMRVAFSVKNHDLVVFNFKINVTHESGEEKLYEWQGLRQQVLQMHTSEGSIPYEKEHSVLAFKLNQKEIEERIIQCQEISFIAGKKVHEDKAIKRLSFDIEQKDFDQIKFLDCQEMLDVYNYIKQAFSWKAGKYKVVFQIETPESFNLVDNEYEFTLIPIDIEALEQNKDNVKQDYINRLTGENHEKYKAVTWNWKNPPLYKKTLHKK